MCVTEIFIDCFPNGRRVRFNRMKPCRYGYQDRPCEYHRILKRPIRYVDYGEETSRFFFSPRSPPQSSSQRHSSAFERGDERPRRSSTPRGRRFSDVAKDAFFGGSRRRERSASKRHSSRRARTPSPPPTSRHSPRFGRSGRGSYSPPHEEYVPRREQTRPHPRWRSPSPPRYQEDRRRQDDRGWRNRQWAADAERKEDHRRRQRQAAERAANQEREEERRYRDWRRRQSAAKDDREPERRRRGQRGNSSAREAMDEAFAREKSEERRRSVQAGIEALEEAALRDRFGRHGSGPGRR